MQISAFGRQVEGYRQIPCKRTSSENFLIQHDVHPPQSLYSLIMHRKSCKHSSSVNIKALANGFNIHSILLNAVERLLNNVERWDEQTLSTFHSTKLSEGPGNLFQAPPLFTPETCKGAIMKFIYLLHFTGQDFTAQRERVQEDFKVLFKGAPPHPLPPFAYERQPQHRDHPTLFE